MASSMPVTRLWATIAQLPQQIFIMLSKNNYEVQDVVRCNITNIMNTNGTSGEKMKKIDALKPINGEQRAQKEIFQYT